MLITWIRIGSIVLFLAVALGAFGAHFLSAKLSIKALATFKTGILYQFIHGLAIFIIAWLTTQTSDPRVNIAGIFFLTGILLFSGSLYILAISEIRWVGILTPLGGLCFLTGWALLIFARY